MSRKKEPFKEKYSGFGERLGRFIEEDSGLSQNKFAEKLGVSQAYVSMIIDGKKNPSSELIAALFVNYGDKLFFLLTGNSEPSHNALLYALECIEQVSDLLLSRQKDMMSRESDGLYGKTEHVDLDGQRFSVTEYAPEGLSPESAELLLLLGMAIKILKSSTPFSESLAMNIRSFHAAVEMQKKWEEKKE